ncbi:alpha/beta hydrolase [Bifidobacterium pseudocatenulatum]|nr:alpha/beta hydrolase [Bifidobacterium pseudocatenulatum]MZM96077.1 alpha/beta hydrolase [Bifidobacterium pseudocatenulatum]MZN02901.1 alpha/beta hydrolase [Bifidobacterium pseudocatenulatum]MZN13307.1 alpha/beta hydrolase [Bifidobacterium pseudocatenulatum]MZN26899.1 alpha/beta hydrolase [Bifidobacterium pseudocatenulatum]
MNGVSDQERQSVMSNAESQSSQWTRSRRLMVSLPIFIILLGILVTVSNLTASSWKYEPTGQTIETLSSDTAVTFDNPSGKTLAKRGDYEVTQRYVTIEAKQPSTGEIQQVKVLIREPKDAGNNRPGVVFMHGAGYGTCDNSFGDMATDLSSAGFVTAVLDKPVWSTNDATRDYPGSAAIYDQVINMLRDLDNVDASNVGIYATSESTWISSYLLGRDPDVAFQVLLSPMVYSPRHSLGFLAAQDFALVGAHDGYQSIVRRAFNIDAELFGLTNLDLDTLNPQAYSIPTLVAYGTKDVMTAQVEGTEKIIDMAHKAGNWDVTVRTYPIANHVLRLGDESNSGTPFADAYVDDVISWAVGTTRGLQQTSERVAGTNLYQSIAVPLELRANSGLTIYLVVLHVSMVLLLLVIAVLWLIVLARKIWAHAHRRRYVLGLIPVFKNALITLAVATMATFVLFGAGLGEVVMGVVKLAWGGAPAEDPGMMYWSWPVIQMVCVVVVWAWSRVFVRLIEEATNRGLAQWPPRKGAIGAIVSGCQPVLASTRFGRVMFWITAVTMLYVLLVFAFWGLFIY